MRLTVNGEAREAPDGVDLAAFLKSLGVAPAKVAVERNREIVPRSAYAEVILEDADQLEIVQFVGGG
jgi:thiamine biosynthesis protein ThiS